MITAKLMFAGFGRRAAGLLAALLLLTVASAVIAASIMVIDGARFALHKLVSEERPDIIQIKARFNRAIFETPRSGRVQPSTLPVYEPLIDPDVLERAAAGAVVVPRQSLLRNTVAGDRFLNLYLFGVDPDREPGVSRFVAARGRLLRPGDADAVVLDQASASALGIDIGGSFTVRAADGTDRPLTVIGILKDEILRSPPPSTIDAPALDTRSPYVSSGALMTLATSRAIFDRDTLTDALVIAPAVDEVPALSARLREAFRLAPGVFITQGYDRFHHQLGDFRATLALFASVATLAAAAAGAFVLALLADVHRSRRNQYRLLLALGFSPAGVVGQLIGFGAAVAISGAAAGIAAAWVLRPRTLAMPSLMADLGAIAPRLDVLASGAPLLVGIVAAIAAAVPMAVDLCRRRPDLR